MLKRLLSICLALCLLISLSAKASTPSLAALAPGDTGQAVRALQNRLVELGLLKSTADGIYGARTQAAVLAAQEYLISRGNTLQADGIAGLQTLLLIYNDEVMSGLLDLRPGDSSRRVSDLQTRLYDLRFLDELPDGVYGDKTRQAVLVFQQILLDHNVSGAQLSGIADHVTRTSLASDLTGLDMRVPQTFDDTRPDMLTADDLYAKSAILIDMQSGLTLLEKDADIRLYPASTTKIMTLLIALDKLPLDRIVTIPKEAADVPKDSSLVPVKPGERMPFQDLLYGLVLRSGNDAAAAVAVLCSGSVEAFVQEMNQKAATLGMRNTHFVNPHGYHDPEHYTTARDLAHLSYAAMGDARFRAIVTAGAYTMQPTKLRPALDIKVSTDLFDPLSVFYYEGALGIKSGYTRLSGFCYAGCAYRDGKLLLAVVLNCRARNQAWTDMGRLFNLGLSQR